MTAWFPVRYDSTTKLISGSFCVAMLVVAYAVHVIAIGALAFVIVLLGYAWSPRAYSVSDDAIVVKRLVGDVKIPLSDIREIRRADSDDFAGCVRLFGSGGLFGYYGVFRTSKLGKSTWYVTDRGNAVVATGFHTTLFSPSDVEGFIDIVSAASPQIESGSSANAGIGSYRRSAFPFGAGIGVAVAALTVGLVALGAWYTPAPEKYVLADRKLSIRDRFYPITLGAADVEIGDARVVDVTSDPAWHTTLRVSGIALPHYASGWFRTANGQNVLMYRVGGKRLVLIPGRGKGTTVLLEVEDPDAFVAQLRREMS